jgi:uncharacterized membrane protein YiaA
VSTLFALARPRTDSDWRRWGLVATACAAAAVLGLCALRIARFQLADMRDPGRVVSQYVQDSGTRGGVLAGLLLCCVPAFVLLIQALRFGSAARERRLAGLRVAGASQSQLRRIAMLEGMGAGVAGAVAGAVGYLVLAALMPHIPSYILRLVPYPDRLDVLAVPVVIVAAAAVAGICARMTAREVVVAPRRVAGRLPRPLPAARGWASVCLVALLAVLTVLVFGYDTWPHTGVFVVVGLAVATAFTLTPYLGVLAARRLTRSDDPVRQLAGARLRADPRTPGRVAAVVAVCGATFMIAVLFSLSVWRVDYNIGGKSYYITGAVLAGVGALIALAVSVVSLVIAAAEQVVEGRRATAALTAFGVAQAELTRAMRVQLGTVTIPSALTGAALAALTTVPLLWSDLRGPLVVLGATALGFACVWTLGVLANRAAVLLVRQQLADATSAENLRTA